MHEEGEIYYTGKIAFNQIQQQSEGKCTKISACVVRAANFPCYLYLRNGELFFAKRTNLKSISSKKVVKAKRRNMVYSRLSKQPLSH